MSARRLEEYAEDVYAITDEFGVIVNSTHSMSVFRRLAPGADAVGTFDLSSEEAELLKDWLNDHIHIKTEYRFV